MVHLYGREMSRQEVLARVGGLDQIAGVRRIRLEDGPEDGVSAVEVRTGGGLGYTVAPSRAMDVVAAECDGLPLAWRTGAGEMHPAYGYRTSGWNLTWFGGLLATCGLDNVGSARTRSTAGSTASPPGRSATGDAGRPGPGPSGASAT
jgi:hypothetical protein